MELQPVYVLIICDKSRETMFRSSWFVSCRQLIIPVMSTAQ